MSEDDGELSLLNIGVDRFQMDKAKNGFECGNRKGMRLRKQPPAGSIICPPVSLSQARLDNIQHIQHTSDHAK